MECKDYREQFTSLLTDTLGQKERSSIEIHLASCADCRKGFEASKKIWDLMGAIPQPEPSVSMQTTFDTMLITIKQEQVIKRKPIAGWLNKFNEYWALQANPR